ncbi:MAG: hypothetical protein ACI4MN_06000 [Candidatus Coproplasma sp.]
MKITKVMLESRLLLTLKANAPVRSTRGAVGKKGTNMYSPYPGNLKNNGIVQTNNGAKLDITHVGYIWYANKNSRKPNYIGKSVDEFLNWCQTLGGRIEKG